MIICWDNLENIRLTKYGNFRDSVKRNSYVYVEECKTCGEPYLRASRYKCQEYCGVSCSRKNKKISQSIRRKMSTSQKKLWENKDHRKMVVDAQKKSWEREEHKKNASKSMKKLWRNIDYKKKMSKILVERWKQKSYRENMCGKNAPGYGKTGEKSPNWDGGYNSNNIPKYDTYAHQIKWIESIRRNKADRNILEVKCAYCGKWFVPSLTNIHHRIQFLKGSKGYRGEFRLYCSEGCKFECPIYGQHFYPKDNKPYISREVQPQLRQMVLERDNYECQKCGSTESLHCHHLEGILWEPLESADIDMCVTLCKNCHIEVHKLPDCGYNDMRCAA